MPKKKANKPKPWGKSDAKELLLQDIIAGDVTDDMMPRVVYQMRPEYQVYKATNFATNYRSLQRWVRVHKAKADADSDALAHDRRIHPPAARAFQGYPRWGGSDAARLLKQDVEAGIADAMMPKSLHESRPEYLQFPLKVFRDHIHQEKRSRMGRSWWMNRGRRN